MKKIIAVILSCLIMSCGDEPNKTIEAPEDKGQQTKEVALKETKKLDPPTVAIIEQKKEIVEVHEKLFSCDSYKLTKSEILDNPKGLAQEKKKGKKVIRSLAAYCPSPYTHLLKSPVSTIEFSKNTPELEKFFCINSDDYKTSKYLKENEAGIKNCIEEFSSITAEHQAIKDDFTLNLKNDIQKLVYDKSFDTKLGYNLYTEAKTKSITLYQSKFSFGGNGKISKWVTTDEYKHENDSFTLNHFYGISEEGIVLKLVKKYAIKTPSVNEAMGSCHQNRNALFEKVNYIKVPTFRTDNSSDIITYFSNKNIIDAECSNYGRTAILQIDYSEFPETLPNDKLINLFATSKLHEQLSDNANAQKYLLAEIKRLEHQTLVKESNQIVEQIYRLCPSPIESLISSSSVKHVYKTSTYINDYNKYKENINSKFALGILDKITPECLGELKQINDKWTETKNKIIKEYDESISYTANIDPELFGITLNKPITKGLVDLDKVTFEEGYYAREYVKNKTPQLNKLPKASTELVLDEAKSGLPIVKGIITNFSTGLDPRSCQLELDNIKLKLKNSHFFLDEKFQHKSYRFYNDSTTFIGNNVVFNGFCDRGKGKFELRVMNEYRPDFEKLTLLNLNDT